MILRSTVIDERKLRAIAGAYNLKAAIGQSRVLSSGRFKGGNLISFNLGLTEPTPKDKTKTAPFQRRGHEGGRISAVCWHGHRDVMKAIFAIDPEARLTTALADYDRADGFDTLYPPTGFRNIGSQIEPMLYRDACDCNE